MSRLKKFFRPKQDRSFPSLEDGEASVYKQPGFRHSLYEATSYGVVPDLGTRPLGGNRISVTRSTSVRSESAVDSRDDVQSSTSGTSRQQSLNAADQRKLDDEMDEILRRMSRTSVVEQRASNKQPSRGDLREFRERRNRMRNLPNETGDAETVPTSSKVVERASHDSTDVSIQKKLAPAVTQETVRERVHEIRNEQITREIHTHDVFHRILPIVDVEVLPIRHFKKEGGRLVEVKPEEVPGRSRNWVVADTLTKGDDFTPLPRKFTARKFEGTDGDTKKYITPEGYERTEEIWVHPPRLETGARDTGQTVPIYL